jgi:hypothetical protein
MFFDGEDGVVVVGIGSFVVLRASVEVDCCARFDNIYDDLDNVFEFGEAGR